MGGQVEQGISHYKVFSVRTKGGKGVCVALRYLFPHSQIGINKHVYIPVHYPIQITHIQVCPVVLDHPVRVEDIRSYLASPGDFFLILVYFLLLLF